MRCALCGGVALKEPDPRMPRLRIPSCAGCRDKIAGGVGWTRSTRRGGRRSGFRIWWRNGASVQVPA